MEPLTRSDVEQIAELARLELSDHEIDQMRAQLTAILDYMQTLQALDTTGVEPMTHAVPMSLRLRDDDVEPSLPVDDAVGPAPDHADGSFRVPKIIAGPGAG